MACLRLKNPLPLSWNMTYRASCEHLFFFFDYKPLNEYLKYGECHFGTFFEGRNGDGFTKIIQWVCQWRLYTCSIYRCYYLRSFTEVLRSYNALKFAKLLCLVLLDAHFPPYILFQGLLDVGWSRLARGTTFYIF